MIAHIIIVIVTGFIAGTLLNGCSTPDVGSPEARSLILEKEEERRAELVEDTLEITPGWFVDLPKSDVAIYTAGTGVSPSLQLSVDKGLLNAKRSLADRLGGLLSSQSKFFVGEAGQSEQTTATTEAEQVTSNLIAEVNVSGYTVKETETHPEGGRYRTFILLEYPLGKLNRIQIDTLRRLQEQESADRSRKAHEELDRNVEEKRL